MLRSDVRANPTNIAQQNLAIGAPSLPFRWCEKTHDVLYV
jgi:hypothetical protein